MRVPKEKEKFLRYETKLDRMLNFVCLQFDFRREYFHLAIEYPNGKRYWVDTGHIMINKRRQKNG